MALLRNGLLSLLLATLAYGGWFVFEFYTPPAAPACRQATPEHFTLSDSAGCLVRRGDKVLTIRRRFHGDLDLPGGLRKWQETAACAAHRETWEETGADVTVGKLAFNICNGYRLYECTVADDWEPDATQSPDWAEEVGSQWINFSEISPDDWRYPKEYDRMRDVIAHKSKGDK